LTICACIPDFRGRDDGFPAEAIGEHLPLNADSAAAKPTDDRVPLWRAEKMDFIAKVRLPSVYSKSIESGDGPGTKIIAVARLKRPCCPRKSYN
jgi:hypothetical protein